MQQHIGRGHSELLTWLSQSWLRDGLPVCFVEGFSGVGKTSVARSLMQAIDQDAVIVNMPEGEIAPVDDLLLDLATELSFAGHDKIADSVSSGQSLEIALTTVLRRPILIIIDEFQRAFIGESGRLLKPLERILQKILDRPKLPGRLLLLSNRLIERGRWSEGYPIQTLSSLAPEEAEELLDKLLKEARREQEVPIERRRDVANWLGHNPRAIRVLVASLERDSLDDLIGMNPEIWELRDREVSEDLLYRLEKELLERTLSHLPKETFIFLKKLSVHRKPVKRKALEIFLANNKTVFTKLRDELIDRFLLEQHMGSFYLNPVAREIALQRLREDAVELKRTHSEAATYYTRHFAAKDIVDNGKLGGYFVEARYHLVRAEQEKYLVEIARKFENYIRSSINLKNPIPEQSEDLNERIAVLSALAESAWSTEVELYLAKLFHARQKEGDLEQALLHARRVTALDASVDSWLLRIELEQQVNGLDSAIRVGKEAINSISENKGLSRFYSYLGNLLAAAGHSDQAICLLKEGIQCIPETQGLSYVYCQAGKLLAEAGQPGEAIVLLREGIQRLPENQKLLNLYQASCISCAKLLAQAGRTDEAIALLHKGIEVAPGNHAPYISCTDLLAQAGRTDEAIALLYKGIEVAPGYHALYISCADLLAQAGRTDEAIALLYKGIEVAPGNHALYISCADLLAQAGRTDEAIALLHKGIEVAPGYHALYISCTDLLAQAGRTDEAIALLYKGIEVAPGNHELYIPCADLLAQAGRTDEAIVRLHKGIQYRPSGHELYIPCADLLAQADRADEAIALLHKGIQAVPDNYALYIPCADLLAQAGRTDEAIALLHKGIQAVPNHHALYIPCADLLAQADRTDEAIALLRKGIQAVPDKRVLIRCADLLAQAGRTDEATGVEQKLLIKNQATMNYHDFQILVTADRKIRASSEQGEEWGELRVEMNRIKLALKLIEPRQTDAELLKSLGGELYQALFPPKIQSHLRATIAGAEAGGYNVRLRLVFESPETAALPWEFLYDEGTNTFLANNTQTVLSRYIDIPVQKRDLKAANKPLKILLVISSPTNLAHLDVAGEERLIREALAKHIDAGQIELDVLPDATIRNINQKLREKPYNVFHYIGHGIFESNKGSIALVDRDGKYKLLDDEGFANFFLGNRSLGLAVLNSCQGATVSSNQVFAGIAPNLVRRGIPAVVAMQYSILDTTAKLFADEFYRTLALNWPVDAAIQTTRNAISQEVGLDKPDFATPVLYMRAKDGMIMSGL